MIPQVHDNEGTHSHKPKTTGLTLGSVTIFTMSLIIFYFKLQKWFVKFLRCGFGAASARLSASWNSY